MIVVLRCVPSKMHEPSLPSIWRSEHGGEMIRDGWADWSIIVHRMRVWANWFENEEQKNSHRSATTTSRDIRQPYGKKETLRPRMTRKETLIDPQVYSSQFQLPKDRPRWRGMHGSMRETILETKPRHPPFGSSIETHLLVPCRCRWVLFAIASWSYQRELRPSNSPSRQILLRPRFP